MATTMDYDAYDAILHYVFGKTQDDAWFKHAEENVSVGVCLRVSSTTDSEAEYRVFPYENTFLAPFATAVRALNPVVAVKLHSAAVQAAWNTVSDKANALHVDTNTRIQILDTMARLPRADKEQCAAFIRDERTLIVWADTLEAIVPACHSFEDKLLNLVWRTKAGQINQKLTSGSTSDSRALASDAAVKYSHITLDTLKGEKDVRKDVSETEKEKDVEEGWTPSPRPIRLYAPVYNGLGAGVSLFFVVSGGVVLLKEWALDGGTTRFALLATSPFLFCISLFFSMQVVTTLSYILGPVAQFHANSRFYSAVPPTPNPLVDSGGLPHVTIQMPVYKESLDKTIAPSVESLKRAMQTYARQGGTSAIFVNDDGLHLLDLEERNARMAFYRDHGIGYVARPPHDDTPGGFKRAGRFKKASNLNYGLALSLKLEKCLKRLEDAMASHHKQGIEYGTDFTDEDMYDTEERALQMAIEETFAETGGKWRPWAANAKSIRMGEIVLIVDSDTVVPEDCLRDAARELAECPEVAILQHESDVMQVAHHYFENGIAYFNRRINRCISMACANGEVAPFVGHNAFLRWSAIQDAAFVDPVDGVQKIWSEANVSEDFDMALRLQLKGYIIRWASYSKGGFKEGVSLTCDDELNRWMKYAYGCSELIFNPLAQWWYKGPINKQLHVFMWSSAPVHYKLNMLSYMFSYYGLAVALVLALVNYILLGLELVPVDGFYQHAFEVWLACTVVFPGAGNIGYTLLEYRLGSRSLLAALVENVRWIPFLFFFFGGMAVHLSQALLAHLLSYNIQWGATKKEVERSNFVKEVPKIIRRSWLSVGLSVLLVVGMFVMASGIVPPDWRVESSNWAVIFPLAVAAGCHILYPIVLNPWLMIFSY